MNTEGPLSEILVIDLTRVLAGPYCTMVLSDLGARVIKVEPPEGDDSRHFGPFINGKSVYFASINRGKESIALDLKIDKDREIFEQLLEKADILVENYRPGTMEKLDYTWEELHERYPRLIYASVSGFGQTGPYSKLPAYDMVIQGMGGIMSITGQPECEPTRVGSSIGDITAALFTSIGINAALYHRQTTGKGMKVDVGMLDCQVAILENAIGRYLASGEIPRPLGSRHPSITPFDAYKTLDAHIIIAAGNDALFNKLCVAIERSDLTTNALFLTNHLRTEHVIALKAELEIVLTTKKTEHWLKILGEAGVPSGPINNIEQLLNEPQILARNMIVTIDDPVVGTLKIAGNPIKLSAFHDPSTRGSVSEINENREDIV
ncbi:CoA transferase [Candidatus Parabeggiatoa sp. HSG14]|uniref:CaiB/BaiF CoA transferase family protein n=1 Tax=Candidatus Parabeggiatoa sp. HSG14 TaxID=3055593 RepID=UPI0025A82462|nr:CoA transferase [Thiotrichales bacterium HSG14]